jgi:hypothetical protein
MNAGFIRRAFSTIIDMVIVFTVIYLSFLLAGRQILRDQVPDFDTIFEAYNEVIEAYNADLELAQVEYSAAVELAAGDEDLEAAAFAIYQSRLAVLDEQNVVDIEPFNLPLSGYFLNIIYYFAIGFVIATGIYSVAGQRQNARPKTRRCKTRRIHQSHYHFLARRCLQILP